MYYTIENTKAWQSHMKELLGLYKEGARPVSLSASGAGYSQDSSVHGEPQA